MSDNGVNTLIESGRVADASAAKSRYEGYQARLMEQAAIKEEMENRISELRTKRTQAERYLHALSERDGPMTEFEPLAWQAVVHHASISPNGIVTFFLRDGSEEKEIVPSGVRQYRKRAQVSAEGCAV